MEAKQTSQKGANKMTSFNADTIDNDHTDSNGMRLELHRNGDDGMIRLVDSDVEDFADDTSGVVSIVKYLDGRFPQAFEAFYTAVERMKADDAAAVDFQVQHNAFAETSFEVKIVSAAARKHFDGAASITMNKSALPGFSARMKLQGLTVV